MSRALEMNSNDSQLGPMQHPKYRLAKDSKADILGRRKYKHRAFYEPSLGSADSCSDTCFRLYMSGIMTSEGKTDNAMMPTINQTKYSLDAITP
jgi:hypothetical protein